MTISASVDAAGFIAEFKIGSNNRYQKEKKMKTNVEINIFGPALCYRKAGENWKVLIPWNDCHKVLFSFGLYGGTASTPVSLAVPKAVVKISVSNPVSSTGQTTAFPKEVFNFTTDATASGYDTHSDVFLRPNWRDKTVALEIENAFFSVDDYVQTRTKERVFRNGQDRNGTSIAGQEIRFHIAHSLRAQVTLDDGGVLSVTRGVYPAAPADEIARISGGGTYLMTINNDCNDVNHGRNDMFLYYDNTIIGGTSADPRPLERYWVGSVGTFDKEAKILSKRAFFTGYVVLAEGKPCMGAQVNSPPPEFP